MLNEKPINRSRNRRQAHQKAVAALVLDLRQNQPAISENRVVALRLSGQELHVLGGVAPLPFCVVSVTSACSVQRKFSQLERPLTPFSHFRNQRAPALGNARAAWKAFAMPKKILKLSFLLEKPR
jgi:hypothetical protein